MSESEPKLGLNERNVCLPFPQPLSRSDGLPIWPFSQKGFPLFYGSTHFDDKYIEINDETGVKALQTMGFFGFHSKFKLSSNNELKANISTKHKKEDSKQTDVSSEIDSKDISCEQMVTDFSVEPNKREKVLKLSFLESFFISYVFGSLNVFNTETNDYMTIERMWNTFGSRYSDDKLEFAVHYSAYHYFRSKGWVVRNGHSFGTQFLLYKEGPNVYHSLYSVLIQYSVDGENKRSFDWYYISALIRLSKNVRKVSTNS